MKTSTWVAVVGAAVAASACGTDLATGERIDKLRLLAVQADQPYAHPGERVALQLLAADADERPLQFALATCHNPKDSSVDGCLDALDGPVEPLTLDEGRFSLDIEADVLRGLPEDGRRSALVGALIVACPGEIGRGETSGVPVTCRDAEGARLSIDEFEVGVKRVFVRSEDRNANPEITSLSWDGEAWPPDLIPEVRACPNTQTDDIEDCAEKQRHRIQVKTSDPDAGTDEFGAAFREQQVVQFYATDGVFEHPARISGEADNHWAAQRKSGKTPTRLWFVARDDRGGVAWAERAVWVK